MPVILTPTHYDSVCACPHPWTAHLAGFRWETNGGDLRHLVDTRADENLRRDAAFRDKVTR